MSFKRRVFQFPLDFGQEHSGRSFSGDLFDDHSIDSNDMFSEETPPGRWDPADMPRFHVPGFSHDFPDTSPFGRQSVGSIFANRPRSAFGDIPIKVSHQRTGSGDASDAESRASGSSDGSTGSARAPKVHHIPIHVETRPQRTNNQPQQNPQHPQHGQPYPAQGSQHPQHPQADVQYRQQEVFPEQQQHQQYFQRRQPPPPQPEESTRFFRSSTPQWREGSPHQFSTMPQFRERTFSDQMSAGKSRPGVRIPVQVERSDSSPVIGEDRFARREPPERGPESHTNTGTFPRAKNHEAPLRWMQGLFKGPRAADQTPDQPPPPPEPTRVPPATVQKPPSQQDKIDKVLADLVELDGKVESFEGTDQKAMEYRFLDEMLTRLMLSLDDVITDGNDVLRAARKAAVKEVQRVIEKLERIVLKNAEVAKQKAAGQAQLASPGDAASPAPPEPKPKQASPPRSREGSPKKHREPSPPKREKSPHKKRHASPVKPPSKKEPTPRRSPSPPKLAPDVKQQQPKQDEPSKSSSESATATTEPTADEKKQEATGVSVIVNGVRLEASEAGQAPQPPQGPTTISVDGTVPKEAAEPPEPEAVLSTASIQLKQK